MFNDSSVVLKEEELADNHLLKIVSSYRAPFYLKFNFGVNATCPTGNSENDPSVIRDHVLPVSHSTFMPFASICQLSKGTTEKSAPVQHLAERRFSPPHRLPAWRLLTVPRGSECSESSRQDIYQIMCLKKI